MAEMSVNEFVRLLGSLPLAVEHEMHKAMDRAARIVEREAKAEIGHYQDAASPFAAWAPLAESTVRE